MAGYSGTPLPQKLGIKPGHRVAAVDAPKDFRGALGKLPDDVTFTDKLGKSPSNVIVWFVTKQSILTRRFTSLAKHLDPSGGLWVAWPKKTSGVATDVNENTIRAVALAAGLVDNKVCAIDDTWSGLRCVIRLKDRPSRL